MTIKSLNSFIDIAGKKSKKRIAVAAAEDQPVLEAVAAAKVVNIVEPILVGDIDKISKIANKIGFDLNGIEIIEEDDPAKSCRKAVELVKTDKAQILMKGLVGTADYLRAILDKEKGLRKGKLLSHIGFFESSFYNKIIGITDAAQNISPNFEEKLEILKNGIEMFHRLGIDNPKVAVVAAVETVNQKMPATIDAALLTMMNKRKQLKGCLIDGPLAFDNAVSKEAAEHKGIQSDVAGDADLLLFPDIESANAVYKCLTYFGGASVAAIILGASCPVVLTSRADSEKSKLLSIALAASY